MPPAAALKTRKETMSGNLALARAEAQVGNSVGAENYYQYADSLSDGEGGCLAPPTLCRPSLAPTKCARAFTSLLFTVACLSETGTY